MEGKNIWICKSCHSVEPCNEWEMLSPSFIMQRSLLNARQLGPASSLCAPPPNISCHLTATWTKTAIWHEATQRSHTHVHTDTHIWTQEHLHIAIVERELSSIGLFLSITSKELREFFTLWSAKDDLLHKNKKTHSMSLDYCKYMLPLNTWLVTVSAEPACGCMLHVLFRRTLHI